MQIEASGRVRVHTWDELNRLPRDMWRAYLADAETVERYHGKVYRREAGCWFWLGAISDTGHGRLRCGTRRADPERPESHVVASHVFGYQLSRGLLRAEAGRVPLIRHKCDEAPCHRPSHWVAGTPAENQADYQARVTVAGSPLTDRRGPARRATVIRDAILGALADGQDVEAAIWSASAEGLPVEQAHLF